MHVVLVPRSEDTVTLHDVDTADPDLPVVARTDVPREDLPALVREREAAASAAARSRGPVDRAAGADVGRAVADAGRDGAHADEQPGERGDPIRWVWSDTALWYPPLLAAGTTVERCWDLRLSRAIVRASALTATSRLALAAPSGWDAPRTAAPVPDGLFDLDPPVVLDPVAELREQLRTVAGAVAEDGRPEHARLGLLLAAESAGALVAAEMTAAGVPWDVAEHDAILTGLLGARPAAGYRPALLEAKAAQVRAALDAPDLNPDSPAELLKALRLAGLPVTSTRSWELRDVDHPAVVPLLEYKKLSRLLTANGWHWLDTWVADGRFRPVYVPGGVVTGRWASDGGGALQLPHQVRGAVRADPGWSLVVADAAQLEPRILAAMSGDEAMATAGQAADMYDGMVAAGAVETRQQAKYGMLGAMYGGTQGESGRMLPRITRAFPQALALVEGAARTGERGGVVSTWLGRSSPRPTEAWRAAQAAASGVDATAPESDRARSEARSWGRFTRNFVVQGTAAEWALCWMALLRLQLRALTPDGPPTAGPHLAFFLHDEIMVHTPTDQAEHVARLVQEAAAEAGRLLFDGTRVEFRLSTAVVTSYADAKSPAAPALPD